MTNTEFSTMDFAVEVAKLAAARRTRLIEAIELQAPDWTDGEAWVQCRQIHASAEVYAVRPGVVRCTVAGPPSVRETWSYVAGEVLDVELPNELYDVPAADEPRISEIGPGAYELRWKIDREVDARARE